METMLIKLFFSFLASSATSVLYNMEKKFIYYCGISGMFTWVVNYFLTSLKMSEALAAFIALIALTFLSRLLSKMTNIPSMIFNISGIMPIVPGGLLFKAFNNLTEKHYEVALNDGTQALLVAASIAMGFILNEVLTIYLYLLKDKIHEVGPVVKKNEKA
ncbi:threonine/serine exporter family protein [Enterococcus sp. LJL98]